MTKKTKQEKAPPVRGSSVQHRPRMQLYDVLPLLTQHVQRVETEAMSRVGTRANSCCCGVDLRERASKYSKPAAAWDALARPRLRPGRVPISAAQRCPHVQTRQPDVRCNGEERRIAITASGAITTPFHVHPPIRPSISPQTTLPSLHAKVYFLLPFPRARSHTQPPDLLLPARAVLHIAVQCRAGQNRTGRARMYTHAAGRPYIRPSARVPHLSCRSDTDVGEIL